MARVGASITRPAPPLSNAACLGSVRRGGRNRTESEAAAGAQKPGARWPSLDGNLDVGPRHADVVTRNGFIRWGPEDLSRPDVELCAM
jgi:hypothetical protein